jgi:hypothetical protein
MPRRKVSWWAHLLPPPTEWFLRRPEGQLLLNLLTNWWIRREALFEVGLRAEAEGYSRPRYGQIACYQMLEAQHYPRLGDREELALDAVHSAFERWTHTLKARTLAQRTHREIQYDLVRAQRSAIEQTDLGLDDLADQLTHLMGSLIHQDVAQLIGQDVLHAVHSAVHASVYCALSDAASHGGHTDGGGHH